MLFVKMTGRKYLIPQIETNEMQSDLLKVVRTTAFASGWMHSFKSRKCKNASFVVAF